MAQSVFTGRFFKSFEITVHWCPYENEEGDVVVFVVAPSLVGILGMGSETLEA